MATFAPFAKSEACHTDIQRLLGKLKRVKMTFAVFVERRRVSL